MADMFGAPVGASQAAADINARKLAELTLDKGAVELEQAKLTLNSQRQMMEMMQGMNVSGAQGAQGGPPQPPQNPLGLQNEPKTDQLANSMEQLAKIAMASGLPEKAREYANTGSTLRMNASTIAKNNFDSTMKELNLIGSLMEGVRDEASWRQANAMYQMQMGKPTPFAKSPYNPQVVEQLRAGVASAKDRALTIAAKARADNAEANKREHNTRQDLIRAQTKLAEARTDKLKKVGAVGVIPKAADIAAIKDLIIKDYGAAILPEDARVLARPVAERMVRMMNDDSITPSQAATRAYQEAKAAGAFGGLRPRPAMGGSADNPLEIPKDASKLRRNMFYKGQGQYKEKTFLWTGQAFVPIGSGEGEIQTTDEEEDEIVEESENPDDELPAQEAE